MKTKPPRQQTYAEAIAPTLRKVRGALRASSVSAEVDVSEHTHEIRVRFHSREDAERLAQILAMHTG